MTNTPTERMTGHHLMAETLGQAAVAWHTNSRHLLLAGKPATKWLEEKSPEMPTPAYVYAGAAITTQVRTVRAVLPATIQLHYAIKANPFAPVVRHLAPLVDGFDCASLAEMQLVADLAPARLTHTSIAGPAKSAAEHRFAIEHGVLINAESKGELRRIADLARTAGKRARIALRVNPPFELKGSGMKMGGGARPFGIDSEEIPALIKDIQSEASFHTALDLGGFHLFAGSQNRDAGAIAATLEQSLALVRDWTTQTGFVPQHLNLGGGFGVVYHPQDTPLDLTALRPVLKRIGEIAQGAWPGVRVNLELGRYLVASAGIYITRIVDRKKSRGKTYLLCDGGMHHHLALSGNLGQVLRRNWPIIAVDHMDAPCAETVDLAGPLCTPLDVLGQNQSLPPLKPGDLIGVLQSGAYGASASPQDFLSRPAPHEYFILD